MKKEYHIGCSGYYYPSWKNKFYPSGLQTKLWLQYYSSVFNSVELNGTFYRTPKLADLKKNRELTQDNFFFSVKMNKHFTHVMKLKNCKQEIEDFQGLIEEGLTDKLSCFLFQFPASFRYNEENLSNILNMIEHNPRNVIELRHSSWWNKIVVKEFTDATLTFCNVDFPGLESYFIHTSSRFYFRLHGNPELFKSAYSELELISFYNKFPSQSKELFIYFNNTMYDAGYTNALQLKRIIEG